MDKIVFLNKAGIILQYFLVFALYLFLWKILLYARLSLLGLKEEKVLLKEKSNIKWYFKIEVAGEVSNLKGKRVLLNDNFFIGRGSKNNLQLQDSAVSYEHACVNLVDGVLEITDLTSTNGVLVNSVKINTTTKIKLGDKVQIGSVILVVED